MAEKAAPPVKPESVDENVNVIEDMISNLKLDIEVRDEQTAVKEEAEELISEANDRIKKGGQALSFMTDYMSPKQIEIVNGFELFYTDLEPSPELGNVNDVAQLAFDILSKSKDGEMTNEELHEAYKKQTEDEEVLNYTKFNIKLRSLFSSQRLLRVEPEEAQNSRQHIIRINGFKAGK